VLALGGPLRQRTRTSAQSPSCASRKATAVHLLGGIHHPSRVRPLICVTLTGHGSRVKVDERPRRRATASAATNPLFEGVSSPRAPLRLWPSALRRAALPGPGEPDPKRSGVRHKRRGTVTAQAALTHPLATVVERRGRRRAPPARRRAGVRRRFAPHEPRHAHALEPAREGVPHNIIQQRPAWKQGRFAFLRLSAWLTKNTSLAGSLVHPARHAVAAAWRQDYWGVRGSRMTSGISRSVRSW
jgi:hypothetical protein